MIPLIAALFQSVPLVVPQTNIMTIQSCGMGCQRVFKQLTIPEVTKDGWTRMQVKEGMYVVLDPESGWLPYRPRKGIVEEGENESTYWIFAHCTKEQVSYGDSADMSDSSEPQDVYYKEGSNAGEPNYQSVNNAPFLKWGPLCPKQAKAGMDEYHSLGEKLHKYLKNLKKN